MPVANEEQDEDPVELPVSLTTGERVEVVDTERLGSKVTLTVGVSVAVSAIVPEGDGD